MVDKVVEVRHLNSRGGVVSTSPKPKTIGPVALVFENGFSIKLQYEGKGLDGYQFSGKEKFSQPNTWCIDYFQGQFICTEAMILFRKKGKLAWTTKQVYEGEFVNNVMHGKGKHWLKNGEVFEGRFENDIRREGVLLYANGNKYIGCFKGIFRDGEGVLTYKNLRTEEGIWSNHRLVKGRVTYINGDVFEGEFDMTAYDNPRKGIFHFNAHGEGYYEGEFATTSVGGALKCKAGHSTSKFKTPNEYICDNCQETIAVNQEMFGCRGCDYDVCLQCVPNVKQVSGPTVPHGEGSWHFPGGDVVSGDWDKGNITNGKILFSNGDSFEGEFDGHKTRNLLSGTLLLRNGDEYTGSFINNLPEGKAILREADGKIFDGLFKTGMRHGVGREIKPDGSTLSAEWKHGELIKIIQITQPAIPIAARASGFHRDAPFADSI